MREHVGWGPPTLGAGVDPLPDPPPFRGREMVVADCDHRATASLSATLWRWWAWVIAIASASAASAVFGSALGRSTPSITRIWFLSAWPAPTTVFVTWFGAYSATVMPYTAGASIATPRAWPSFRVAA